MKQVELARKLGISKSYLSMILSGQRIPNPDLIERISSLLPVNFKASFLPHNPKVVGSNPTPATSGNYRLALQESAFLFLLTWLRWYNTLDYQEAGSDPKTASSRF